MYLAKNALFCGRTLIPKDTVPVFIHIYLLADGTTLLSSQEQLIIQK